MNKLYLTANFILVLLAGLIYSILLSRLLAVEGRGLLYQYQLISLIVATALYASFSQPIYEYLKKYQLHFFNPSYLLTILSIGVLISMAISWLIVFKFDNLEYFYLAIMVCSQGGVLLVLGYYKYILEIKRYKFFVSAQAVIPALCVLIWSYLGSSFDATSAALVISTSYLILLIALVLYLLNISAPKKLELGVLNNRYFLNRSIRMFSLVVLSMVVNYIDKTVLMIVTDSTIMGLIAICVSLETISSKLFQYLTNIKMNSITAEQQKDTLKLTYLALFLGFLGIIFTISSGEFLITLLFGNEFREAHKYLLPIIAISVLNGYAWIISQKWLLEDSLLPVYLRQFMGVAIFLLLVAISSFLDNLTAIVVLESALLSSIIRFIYTIIHNRKKYGKFIL